MKSITTLSFLLFFIISTYSQSKFEPGYFINSDGVKTECLINNKDWRNNPKEIEYKTTLSSSPQDIGIDDLQEFGIDGFSKYIKHNVIVDKFDENTRDVNLQLNYDYQKDTVLLKVLVEGKASLYLCEGPTYRRYFFSTEKMPPEQFIYKSYKEYQRGGGRNKLVNTKLQYNRLFRLQIYDHLKCEGITTETIVKVKFERNSLIDLFNTYNYCHDSKSINYNDLRKRNQFNFTPRIGIGLTTLNTANSRLNSFSFSNKITYKIGFEIEYILPYDNGRWSLTVEPAYVNISQSDSISTSSLGILNYNAIQMPIGLRYNRNLSSNTKIYGTVLNAPEFSIGSDIQRGPNVNYEIESFNNFFIQDYAFGIGIVTKKMNVEVRYHFDREIIPTVGNSLEYGITYLILGYQL